MAARPQSTTPPPKPGRPGLWQASSLLFVALMAGNVCNYIFHGLASRALGPANYGALVSLLALLTVLSIPSQAIQTAVANRVAGAAHPEAHRLARFFLGRFTLLGLLLCLLLLLLLPFLKDFLRLAERAPLVMVGVTTVVMLAIPVIRGMLQGLQQIPGLGMNLLTDSLCRLGSGGLLLGLGAGVAGALAASAIGAAAALAVSLVLMARTSARATAPAALPAAAISADELPRLFGYMLPVLAIYGAYLVLSSLDVIAVKHLFPATAAGFYGAASMVGKAFLFLPLAVGQVLFPKVSEHRAQDHVHVPMLFKSLGMTTAVLLAGIAAVWLLTTPIILTLFGPSYLNPETIGLVRGFGLAMSPLALLYILLQYQLALRKFGLLWMMLIDIPLCWALLFARHAQLAEVQVAVGLNHGLLLAIGLGLTLWRARKDA